MMQTDNQSSFPLAPKPENVTAPLLRLGGYALVVMAILDIVEALIRPQFMDPVWELQFMGVIVERVPVPLIAVLLVIYGERESRRSWEKWPLRLISWGSLAYGVALFLIIPFGMNSTTRVLDRSAVGLRNALEQQTAQKQKVLEGLNTATADDVERILKGRGLQTEGKNLQQLKSDLVSELTKAEKAFRSRQETKRKEDRVTLLANSGKRMIGALIGGLVFILVWKSTDWARHSRR